MDSGYVFRYGELEVAIDPTDYAFSEKMEKAMRKMVDTAESVRKNPSGASNSQQLRSLTESALKVFDDMFGQGSAKKAVGNCTSLLEAEKAVQAFVDFKREAVDSAQKQMNTMASKYGPNRAARRAAAKK